MPQVRGVGALLMVLGLALGLWADCDSAPPATTATAPVAATASAAPDHAASPPSSPGSPPAVARPDAAGPTDPPATTPPATPVPAAPADPWAGRRRDLLRPLTNPDDQRILAEIGQTVAERRGLPLLAPVPVYLIDREDLPAYFLSTYTAADRQAVALEEAIDRLLGIIGPDDDLLALLQDLYHGRVIGFYDWTVDAFLIVSADNRLARENLATVVHEYVHALQDQHGDLAAAFADAPTLDAANALRFLVEGDARTAEADFPDVAARYGGQLIDAADYLPGPTLEVPPPLDAYFLAPYRLGVTAVQAILAESGRTAVDALIAARPRSTEHLLHPEKRAAAEPPLAVDAPDLAAALGTGWTVLGQTGLGEYLIRLVLEVSLTDNVAAQAAAGWGGDALTVYRAPAGDPLLAWRVRWDTPADAEEFFTAFLAWLDPGGAAGGSTETPSVRATHGAAAFWARRRGADTWIVGGGDAAAVARAARALTDGALFNENASPR